MKDAEIVALGTEILLGELVDTNTPWISRKLAALGVAVNRHTTVGDDKERIVATFLETALRADLVITVGGLGATPDDLTHECLSEATSRELVEYSEAKAAFGRGVRALCRAQATPLGLQASPLPGGL